MRPKVKGRQGVQLTLNTVVIAVLVIIVLIVLILIFTKGTGGFLGGITSCEDRKGFCASSSDSCTNSGGSVYRLGKCPEGQVCCIPEENLVEDNQNDFQ